MAARLWDKKAEESLDRMFTQLSMVVGALLYAWLGWSIVIVAGVVAIWHFSRAWKAAGEAAEEVYRREH